MVGPIQTSTPNMSMTERQRSKRFSVDIEASVESEGQTAPVLVRDISESGAAILGDAPELTNEQFLDLHIEGYNRLHGRVVREFSGGYAMQFSSEDGPAISEEELAEFRRKAAIKG